MNKNITDKKWEKTSTRRTTIHRYFDYSESSFLGLQKIIGNNIPDSIIISEDGEIFHYQPTEQIRSFNDSFKTFLEKKKNIEKIKDQMYIESSNFIDWLKNNCAKDKIANLSDQEIKDLIVSRHKGHITLLDWQWIGFSGKYVLDSILHDILAKYQIDIVGGIETIYKHHKPIHAIEEDLNVKKIALSSQKGEDIEKDLEDHLEKYQGIYMYDETYDFVTKEQIVSRIEKYLEDDSLESEIRRIELEYKENELKYKAFLKSNSFTQDDLIFIGFARSFSDFMELRNMYRGLSAFYSKDFFAEIGKRLQIDLVDVLAYSDYEIIEFLDNSKENIKEEAFRRRKYAAFFYERGDWRVLSDNDSVFIKSIVNAENEISEFKGMVAFKASPMRGTVKIINSMADMEKLESGDILVSSMTRPEFIMSIERAGAIITDEGGLLCHAAIVSRELKKPCIIGTKIATKVLKDGMTVEVDADAGIVRILDR